MTIGRRSRPGLRRPDGSFGASEDGLRGRRRHPTVIELFQSQGCSSCPPANANVAWAARDDVLALTFAVDYWDRLGWKDTFAKPAFTARQYAYARSLGHGEVYTPQTIVNGRADVDRRRRRRTCRRWRGARIAAPAARTLSIAGGTRGDRRGRRAARRRRGLARALRSRRRVEVAVKRGENAGRLLPPRPCRRRPRPARPLARRGGERFDLPAKSRSAAGRRRAGAGRRDRADPRRRQRYAPSNARRRRVAPLPPRCSFCICSSLTRPPSRLGRGAAWWRA